MGNKEKTFVDDAVLEIRGIASQISFVTNITGGNEARLNLSSKELHSFLLNIECQIYDQINFLLRRQREEQETTSGQPTMRPEK